MPSAVPVPVNPSSSSRGAHRLAVSVVVLVAVVLSARGGATPTLTEDGERFAVTPGDRFEVVMRETPGVGENWQIADVDEAVAVQIGRKRHRHDSDLDGSSGYSTFEFEAVAAGDAEIRFEQDFRGEEIIARMSVTVIVEP